MDVDRHIAEKAHELLDSLPAGTRNLVKRLTWDLYRGPVYLAPADDWPFEMIEVSYLDKGARQFDFQGACDELTDILDELDGPWYYEWDSGCWSSYEPRGGWYCEETDEYVSEEPDRTDKEWEYLEPEPYYEVGQSEIIREMLGSELARYV